MRARDALGLKERETLAGRSRLRHCAARVLLLALVLTGDVRGQDAAAAGGAAAPAPAPVGAAPAAAAGAPPESASAPDGAAPAPVASPASTSTSTAAAAPPADPAAGEAGSDREAEARAAGGLARGRRSDEVVRLTVDANEVLALWRSGEAARARGGVVLLHTVPGSLDEPAVTGALRRALPASGFSTLSVALPVPAPGAAVMGSPAWQEEIRKRLAAAFAWMVANDGPVVALIGHGTSAAHVKRLVEVATGRPEGLQAVVLIEAGAGLESTESAWRQPLPVPVLDLVPEHADEDARHLASQRRTSARRLGGAEYRSVSVAGVGEDWYPARQRLVAAVRGFLLRHTGSPGADSD